MVLQDNITPLMLAAGRNDVNTVTVLLDAGSPIDAVNTVRDIWSCRHVVSYVITVRMLVCSQFGMTALMGAVFYSALEVTKLLLQRGASIHVKGLVRVASLPGSGVVVYCNVGCVHSLVFARTRTRL